MKLYGTKYGGFYLPDNLNLDDNSVVYCAGVGEDISFDVLIANQYNCNIYMFDPTPRAIVHTNMIKDCFKSNITPESNNRFGGGDSNYINLLFSHKVDPNKLILHEYGIFTSDTHLNFFAPENKEFVSHSLIQKNMSNDYINVPVKSISSIMKNLGHDHIDLLKLDIEGVECDVLIQLFENNIFPKYVCVDFDSIRRKLVDDVVINKCIDKFKEHGYSIYMNDNLDITFIKQ